MVHIKPNYMQIKPNYTQETTSPQHSTSKEKKPQILA